MPELQGQHGIDHGAGSGNPRLRTSQLNWLRAGYLVLYVHHMVSVNPSKQVWGDSQKALVGSGDSYWTSLHHRGGRRERWHRKDTAHCPMQR